MIQPHELPPPAKIKLMRLHQDAYDALALIRADNASASSLEDQIVRLRNRIDSCDPAKDVAAIKTFEDEITMLEEELKRLHVQTAARRQRMQVARQLVIQIGEVWLPRCPRGTNFQIAGSVKAALHSGESLPQAIERVRREIAGLDSEARQLRGAPVSSEELKAHARKMVAKLAGQGEPFIDGRDADKIIMQFPIGVTPYQFLAWADPGQLLASLDAKIDTLTNGRGVSTERKRQRLEELAAEILHRERVEEALIEQATAEGLSPLRRPVANPLAVLGLCIADARTKMAAE